MYGFKKFVTRRKKAEPGLMFFDDKDVPYYRYSELHLKI